MSDVAFRTVMIKAVAHVAIALINIRKSIGRAKHPWTPGVVASWPDTNWVFAELFTETGNDIRVISGDVLCFERI